MSAFIETFACKSRIHCPTCRIHAGFRRSTGAPDVCPNGITDETDFDFMRLTDGKAAPKQPCKERKHAN